METNHTNKQSTEPSGRQTTRAQTQKYHPDQNCWQNAKVKEKEKETDLVLPKREPINLQNAGSNKMGLEFGRREPIEKNREERDQKNPPHSSKNLAT